jgi:hypothetical protein
MAIDIFTGEKIGGEEQAPPPAPRERRGMPLSAAAGASQGVTAGFGDELYGLLTGYEGLGTPGGVGSIIAMLAGGLDRRNLGLSPMSYEQRRDSARQLNREAREDNPIAFTGAEIAGALAAPSAVAAAPRSMSPLGRLAMGSSVGAAEGGAAAYGYSEGGQSAPGEVGMGASMGAVMGPVGQAAPAVAAGVRRMGDIASSTPVQRAEALIGQDIVQGGNMTTGQQVAAELQSLGGRGMLADMAPDAAVAATQRAGGGELLQAVTERQEGAPLRILSTLESMLGQSSAVYRGRVQSLRDKAGELGLIYDELRGIPVPREPFAELLDADSSMVQSAIRNARDEMVENGFGSFDMDADELPMGFIDALKKEFDAVAAQAGGPGSGRSGQEGARATAISQRIRQAADSVVTEYAPLRERYGEVLQSLQALGASPPGKPVPPLSGRRLMDTSDPRRIEDIMDFASTLSPMGMQDFRLGVAQSASDFVRRNATATGDLAGRLRPDVEGGARADAMLRSAQTPEAGRAALEALQGESTMRSTYGRISPDVNSRTAPNQAAQARLGSTVFDAVREILFPAGLTEETAKEMRKLLVRGDLTPEELDRIVQAGAREGLLEVPPEVVREWMDYTLRGYRSAYGALQEQ